MTTIPAATLSRVGPAEPGAPALEQQQQAQQAQQAQDAATLAREAAREAQVEVAKLLEQQRVRIVDAPGNATPSAIYTALVAQRRELREQLSDLEDKRNELARDMTRENDAPASVAGIEARIKALDARIAALDAQVAQADMAVARAAAIPGAIVERPPTPRQGPGEEVFIIGTIFMLITLLPLSIAYARRIWRRGATVIAPVPREVQEKIDNLTQAVDAIGLEVERIGEGQRFVTRVLSESRERVPEQLR